MVPALRMARRAAPSRGGDDVADAVPGEAGAEFGELVGGVAAAEQVENAFEAGPGESAEGGGAADEVVEVVDADFGAWDSGSEGGLGLGASGLGPGAVTRDGADGAGLLVSAPGTVRCVRRVGDDGDDLLGEDVEGVAGKAGGLDVALVHGAGDGGAGDEVGAVLGEEDAFADGVDRVAGAADALHAAGDRGWRFDLDDQVDGAHIDAEFERGGGAEGFDLAGLELLFDDRALGGGEGAVVGAGDGFAGEIVEAPARRSATWRLLTKRMVEFRSRMSSKQAGMDGVPDGDAARHLRSGTAGQLPR